MSPHARALRMPKPARRALLLARGWQRIGGATGSEMWVNQREGSTFFTLFTATRRELERDPLAEADALYRAHAASGQHRPTGGAS